MTRDDEAFVRWATRRHGWLWRLALDRRWKSKIARQMVTRAAAFSMRLDRVAWESGLIARR